MPKKKKKEAWREELEKLRKRIEELEKDRPHIPYVPPVNPDPYPYPWRPWPERPQWYPPFSPWCQCG